MTGLPRDTRDALRQLRRSPAFTVAAVASLGVGMTALTVTFSGLNVLLFRSTPGIAEQARLVRISIARPSETIRVAGGLRAADVDELRRTLTSFSGLAAWTSVRVAVDTGGEPRAVRAERVSANYFSVLGSPVPVALERGAPEPMAVVSHGFAVRNFGTPASAMAATVGVNGIGTKIAAVAPPGFTGTSSPGFGQSERDGTQVWLPLAERDSLQLFGRLATSATLASARAEAATVHPGAEGAVLSLKPLAVAMSDSPSEIVTGIILMFAVPVIVLMIGCANAANLLLVRATRRRAEMAVRLSLGATRARLVRLLLAESVLVAAVAGALGVAATPLVLASIAALVPVPVPVDARVAAFALVITVVTGVLFGLAPALTATRRDLITSLRDAGSGLPPRSRLRGGLVVAQIALSLVLLVLAGLCIRTFQHLQDNSDDGRDLAHVAAVTLDFGIADYSAGTSLVLERALVDRAMRIPGVTSAAIAGIAPYGNFGSVFYRPADQSSARERDANGGGAIGPFVDAAGLTVIAGRNFSDDERRAPVPATTIVSEALADRAWPGEEPLGKRLMVRRFEGDPIVVSVIGITRDVADPIDNVSRDTILLPTPLAFDTTVSLWVRTAGDPALAVPHLRQIVRDLDPRLPILRGGVASDWRDVRLGPIRWVAAGLSGVGLVALLLAAGGLYAVMTYLVAARRHEMGVRSALGAGPRDLVRLVGGEAMRLALAGLAVGLLLALPSALIARALVFGLSPFDPVVFAAVAGLLTIVALLASASPARRAALVDPMDVLRTT